MIQFMTGLPRSGKSYYGIFNIAIHFAKDLKDNSKFKSYALTKTKYNQCLTNINDLKLDKFENVYEFDINEFKKDLSYLYAMYKTGSTDDELKEAIKDKMFFNTLIVVDECHNFMSKDDELLVWWLSYHGHFYQDIILITQDLSLVNKKYKAFSEYYYKAVPSSRKLFNTQMIYHQYIGHQMYQKQKTVTKKLPIIKEIFTLYGSGENNKQKSLILHFLIVALLLLFVLILSFYFFIASFTDTPKEEPQPQQIITQTITQPQQTQNNTLNIDNSIYIMTCTNNLCTINNNTYEIGFINEILINHYETKIIYQSNNKLYLTFDDKYNLFEKTGVFDEENTNNSTFPNFFSSGN